MEDNELAFKEQKEKGNAYIKEKRYQEAVECYSSALKLKPTEHTVFSNRSLAYLRIGKLEEALSDARKCVEISPNFSRGYMRKAVALNMLGQHQEARETSVAGYLLRGSDNISKECISQWLLATEKLFEDFYKIGGLPTGTVILSDAYFVSLFDVLQSRRSSTSGMSTEKMRKCLLDVVSQLKDTLSTFGHSASDCMDEWIEALYQCSSKIDPQTSILPKSVLKSTIEKSEIFAKWVNSEVDSIIYSIFRPLLILAVMVVLSHTYVLNCMNLGHATIQVLSQACLVLFEQSILNTEEYLGHHIGTIVGLLDSFVGRGTALTQDDEKLVKHYCSKTELLLSQYETTTAWEKMEVKDIAIRVITNVRGTLKLESSGVIVHSEFLPEESLMSGEVAKRDALAKPIEVMEYMETLVKTVRAKSPHQLLFRDGENLIHGSVGLMKLQKVHKSLEAFMLGEQTFFQVLALQARSGIWTLEAAPSMVSSSRNDILLTALSLHPLDPSLLPGVLVRWKCLYSEFRAVLMDFGLKSHYFRAFSSIDQLRRTELLKSERDTSFQSVMQQYQCDQMAILEKWGAALITQLSRQSPKMIQHVLEPNEAVLDIVVVATTPVDICKPGTVQMTGILLLLLPQGNPIVEVIDFHPLFVLIKEWPKKLNEVVTCPPEDAAKCEKLQDEADVIGRKISNILFPDVMKSVINGGKVSCLYLCPDVSLSNLPLDLLPWEDGKYLFEKCSISYLSSCREALREWCLHLHDNNENETSDTASKRNSVTNSISTECLIFADPDYDLKDDAQDGGGILSSGFWDLLKDSLGISSHSGSKRVEHLPKSMKEAKEVGQILSLPENGLLKSKILSGGNATLLQAIQVESPFLVHFSTHGFSQPSGANLYGGNFWTDMTTGLALAGINTYRFEKPNKILPAAGTGELTAMAACGMKLKRTRLVYLSTCVSSIGFTTAGESVGSLAQAFRAAGAETVVATLWPVLDEAARKFAVHFYNALCNRGTKPSQAIVEAKQKLRQDTDFEHWFCWAPFICIGYNLPLFC